MRYIILNERPTRKTLCAYIKLCEKKKVGMIPKR